MGTDRRFILEYSGKHEYSRIFRKTRIFSNIPEKHEAQIKVKQHLHKLAAKADNNSLIRTAIALSVPHGVYQLTSSHCGYNSKHDPSRSTRSKSKGDSTRSKSKKHTAL
ncbi:hypothetical protein AVEN_269088-1 [Araneus ventricosus]|uniref:Uncharacterized protein n=1 Tax=Araneus ventricosus TaxID=182803 RepID=A0A4Y2JI99_ARAVE|nr:hypothetical protein AVEN_269088-1 [Araneus ventricosus]